jgi:hypothetical protein
MHTYIVLVMAIWEDFTDCIMIIKRRQIKHDHYDSCWVYKYVCVWERETEREGEGLKETEQAVLICYETM